MKYIKIKYKPFIILLCTFFILSLSGCTSEKNDEKEKNNDTQIITEEEMVGDTELVIADDAMMGFESPCGTLNFTDRWDEKIRIENDTNIISFYGTVEGKEEELLFNLIFGESEETLLGYLGDEEIHLFVNEPAFDDSWSEDEKDEFFAMQEDVNVIFQDLMTRDEFHLAD